MSINVKVNAGDQGKPLKHYWSECVGAGRANEGLRANWQEQLRLAVEECGFKNLRFHGLFHDDMFVYREEDGREIYNWQYVDELFDMMLATGIRPFVELGFCPKHMATELETVFWWKGHGSPPKDHTKWAKLVENFVRHCIDRYGLDEVRTWYFEVWNEPNLGVFFRGTKSQYFQLYKISAETIKSIDGGLRVGGPATSNFIADGRYDGEREDFSKRLPVEADKLDSYDWTAPWIEEFLTFCQTEKLPVDFISTHPYPTDFALDGHGEYQCTSRPVSSAQHDLKWLRNTVARSAYPEAEIHLTEWSSSPSCRDYTHDYLQSAAFVAKANIDSTDLVDSLAYWTFTDVFEEQGAGDTIFHGGFGMINFQGIVKPTFHAYRFLHLLGDEELVRQDGCIVTRNSADGYISALAYHYPPEMPDAVSVSMDCPDKAEEVLALGKPQQVHIEINDLPPKTGFMVETLDKEHGFAFRQWQELGCPNSPARQQIAYLREAAMNTKKEFLAADKDGIFILDRKIAPWSLVSLRQLS